MIGNPVADDVNDLAFLLKPTTDRDHRGGHDLAPVDIEAIWPQDAVGDAGLVLNRDEEHALRRARALPHEYHPGDLDVAPVSDLSEIGAAHDTHRVKLIPQETQWMRAQRSEEHTSELQSLMCTSYAVFCLTKKIILKYN